jgi:alanyl-tRNA synthetase
MTTDKLYLWSAVLEAEATVTALLDGERKIVRLSRTVFHPQGGGQRADGGAIGGQPVLDVRHAEGGEVDHVVSSFDGLAVGATVQLRVDAAKRKLHARLHSAGHLIADAGAMVAPQIVGKAGHHWPREARVEFDGAVDDIPAFTAALSAKLGELVAQNLPLAVLGDPSSVRRVKICGDEVPCGGTHVAALGEIGPIAIRRVQAKGGMLRVSYGVAGEEA